MSPSRSEHSGGVQALVFDFYGTVARAVTWGPPLEDVLARRGLQLPPDVYERWRGEVFDGQEHLEQSTSRDHYLRWERARLTRLVASAGTALDHHDVESIVGDLHAATQAFQLAAYPEVPRVLDQLRELGLKLGVCSNWGWDLDRALDQAGLATHFDVAVTSAQAGARKPHPRIFEQTLARTGTAPEHTMFVGDTWIPDIEGALAAGLRPVHVWRTDAPPGVEPPPVGNGVARVTDLTELLSLI